MLKKLATKAAMRLRSESFWSSSIEIFVRFLGQDSWRARCSLTETQDTLTFIQQDASPFRRLILIR